MSAPTPLGELIEAIAGGLAQPRHAWEAAAIALALGLAAILAHASVRLMQVRRASGQGAAGSSVAAPGTGVGDGASALADRGALAVRPQLLFPFLALLLLWIAEAVLHREQVLENAADARLLRLAASLVGMLAVVRVLFMLIRRAFRSTALVARFERVIAALAILGVALYATGVLGDVVERLASTEIPLGSATRVSLWSILVGSTTILVSLLAAMWLGSLIEERLRSVTGIEANLRTVLARVARALLLVAAVLLAMAFSGIDLTILSVFGGALGVGLGLGLQRIASNYVSGFILLLDRSLRIGDMVAVDKYYGQVTQISTRYTVLRGSDGTDTIVPNEMLVSSPVVNSTFGDRTLVLSVAVTVGVDTELAPALAMLREAARAQPRVLSAPEPVALLREFQGGNLVLQVNFWIADPENGRQNVESDVAIAVLERFRTHGIALAVPRGDFQLVDRSVVPDAHPAGARPIGPAAPPPG